MISYIKGELADVTEQSIVLECAGIGYEIAVPVSTLTELPSIGNEVKIHTYLYVREDAVNLYGFLTKEDLYVFKLLIGVNGIGPKGALGILSAITPDELRFAILADDVKTIAKAPGIGNKTAQKLIIELKDKLKLSDVFEQSLAAKTKGVESVETAGQDIRSEAVQALASLGYSLSEATKAVGKVEITADTTVEQLLKDALKKISIL
ncbi:MAG: Holliday junction branch migration protein RuvA [Lachnospiraceae bacterium]|nr:Holliday junction branch migration protein RuvA [Lachnospiraceae bacterium]